MADIFADTRLDKITPHYSGDGDIDSLKAAAEITSHWDFFGPSGGYLAAILWRAIIQVIDAGMSPLSFTCQYLAQPRPGHAAAEVEVVSRSKRTAVCAAELLVDGTRTVSALARFVHARDGLEIADPHLTQPAVPAPERLRPLLELVPAAGAAPFMRNVDLRVVTDEAEWPLRRRVRPYSASWVRFEPQACHDERLVDAVRTLILADALIWPAAERAYRGRPTHAARSTDLFVSFLNTDAGTPWLLCETGIASARTGAISGWARVWSQDGRLVAIGLSNMYCAIRLEAEDE